MSELAERFGMEVCHQVPQVAPEMRGRISYAFAKKHLVLPLSIEEGEVVVATADPLNIDPLDEVRLLLGAPVRALFCKEELLLTAIHDTFADGGANAQPEEGLEDGDAAPLRDHEVYDLLDQQSAPPVVQLLNKILKAAIEQGASDIHFEPLEMDLRVRYRIDGVLQKRPAPPLDKQAQLLTRIKVMAKLDIAEHRLPQDGRIKLLMGGREIDFRVSTLPVSNGERIVLRILDKGNVVLGLDKIGMVSDTLQALRHLVTMPEGLLLVTGPTGSGKTTTLYSALSEIYSDEINVMTVEDPVEYKLPGIAQIGVKPKIGLTFATGLRHILRQDPDVVMVGEIRDQETAEIAIQASLTGHFVLSTLHTNDAPSALTRLVDMGVEPYLLSSSVVGVLAQRLVRTLCKGCGGSGCDSCFGSGYKGRCGIYELMPVNSAIKQQLSVSADATKLREVAIECGMKTLADQGRQLVAEGITTPAEILRVTRGISEV